MYCGYFLSLLAQNGRSSTTHVDHILKPVITLQHPFRIHYSFMSIGYCFVIARDTLTLLKASKFWDTEMIYTQNPSHFCWGLRKATTTESIQTSRTLPLLLCSATQHRHISLHQA